MAKLGFYYDQTRCSGCRACQVMCKDVHDLPVGELYRNVRTFEQGDYPNPGYYHYSWSCNHCETPACMLNCPEKAIYVADDGTVQIDADACTGCKICVTACPYGVPTYRASTSVVGKCDTCKAWRDKGERAACVDACTMRCLDFGDLDELKAKYGSDLVNEIPILPAPVTNPSILIKPRECALERDFDQKYI